jgi:hypothetical protein
MFATLSRHNNPQGVAIWYKKVQKDPPLGPRHPKDPRRKGYCFVCPSLMFPPPHPSLKVAPPQGVLSYDQIADVVVVVSVCVFISAGPSTKLFTWGGGGYGRTFATRDDEPRPVWTRLPITH